MKKAIFLLCVFSISFFALAEQPTYSRVKIFIDTHSYTQLMATGIEITGSDPYKKWYLAEISLAEINDLISAGFRYEIMIPDMEKYYKERFLEKVPSTESNILLNEAWPQPVNFSLGSCGGFSTIDEMIAQLDKMRSLFPNLISIKHTLNDTVTTIEGRPVYYVRISDNPDLNEPEPEVLYSGMHHAREAIGMQHLLYYMWYLLENYSSDPSIKHLVDNTEMYFVPVFNVDGYAFNITNNPAGGGMWRKNRRKNTDGSYGIDINRNYGYKWGIDNSGSSPSPSSETYRGTAAFSEPETRMMKYFCESHNFNIAINYHSYSNLFLYPWGYTALACADADKFDVYAKLMTIENAYTYGAASTTIYPTNGGSDDWMYGEQITKPAIFSYTPEIGNDNDGFWPVQQRILPLIQENMLASITAARLAGNYGTVKDDSPLFIYKMSGYLPFEAKQIGMKEGSFSVSIVPLGNAFLSVGPTKSFQGLSFFEKRNDSISYKINNSIHVGDSIQYILVVDNGYFTQYDTVTHIFGYPNTVFADDLPDKNNWIGSWNLTTSQYYSPTSSLTDSPTGNYSPSADKSILLTNEVNLAGYRIMVLQFRAKWSLENDYDFVQLSISDDNGITWNPLNGKYTNPGTNYQLQGQPVYDGNMDEWIREDISLNNYIGKKIKLRFRLKSDQGTEMDGFYFDDIKISTIIDPTSVSKNLFLTAHLGNPYPNPANKSFEISYNLPDNASKYQLRLSTASGAEVSVQLLNAQKKTANIDISKLKAGIYFIKITSEGFTSPVKKLVVY